MNIRLKGARFSVPGIGGIGPFRISHGSLSFVPQLAKRMRPSDLLSVSAVSQQALGVGFRNSGERFPASDIAEPAQLRQLRTSGGRQLKEPGPPVAWIRMPFDQAQRLELVEDAAKRDRLDFQQSAKPLWLMPSFFAR